MEYAILLWKKNSLTKEMKGDKKLMRQTNLSFEELVYFSQNLEKSPYPLCLIINEIGEIALIDRDTRAVKALIDFLENPNAAARYTACCWIKECTVLAAVCPLEKLLENEKNKQVIIAVGNALRKLKYILGD